MKRVYQWVGFDLNTEKRQVKLTNKYLDRNLNQFYLKWTLLADGKPVQDGTFKDLNCAAGGTQTVNLKYNPSKYANKELFLNIGLYTKEATDWCAANYPVAEYQQQLAQRTETLAKVDNTKAAALHATKNSDGGYTYTNDKQKVTFDGQGNITLGLTMVIMSSDQTMDHNSTAIAGLRTMVRWRLTAMLLPTMV